MPSSVYWICSWSAAEKVGGGTAHGRQRTDSTHILAKIRALNRVLCVAQTMVYVLNVLSEVAPEWVRAYVPAEWVERYGERLEHERLLKARRKSGSTMPIRWEPTAGLSCMRLPAASTADWMKTLPAIQTLRTSLRATV